MRERRSHSIRCVRRLRRRFQSEQPHHHELNLQFRGGTSADDCLLYFRRRIFRNVDIRIRGSEKNHPSRVPEHDRSAYVARVENVLYRDRVGPVPLDQLDDPGVNLLKPERERIAGLRAKNSAFDQLRRRHPLASHDAVAGDGRSGVNSENNQLLLLSLRPCVSALFVLCVASALCDL